jgi:hypothetical protein
MGYIFQHDIDTVEYDKPLLTLTNCEGVNEVQRNGAWHPTCFCCLDPGGWFSKDFNVVSHMRDV